MIYHSTYHGVIVWRQVAPNTLRWFAFTPNGRVVADTLRGLRRAIQENVKHHE